MFLFSEKQLIIRLRNEATREEAFGIVVKQYKEKLYWYVRRMVIDYHGAKDVTQNVFIKAWENLDKFKYQASIYTWLYRIATNEALNYLRQQCRRASIPIEDVSEYLLRTLDNGQYISGEEIYLRLEKAVARLPEKQRLVFILRYFEEKSYQKIAEITGTSEGALHATYYQAVKKIEQMLE